MVASHLELAAGTAGPARGLVSLPPPFPRHTRGGTETPRARPDPYPAAPRRRLVLAERHARGGAGVLDGGRGRRRGRWPDRETRGADPPARPGHHRPAVVPVAGGSGRGRGTPDGRCACLALLRVDGAAGRGRAVGRRGRSLAVRG